MGEESFEESGMTEESSSVTGERGGGPGVAGLRQVQGRGTGMVIDKEGGAEADRTQSGIGCPSLSGNWTCRIYVFLLNFYFSMLLRLFPPMFPLLTYSQSFFSLICPSPETHKTKEKQDSILLIQETV